MIQENNENMIKTYTNEEIIERHLKRYISSPESVKTRRSCFNFFFDKKYFGFQKHISEISKNNLIDYFDWLNQKKCLSLTTKQLKWRLLKSLLTFCLEYYDDFNVKIPSKTVLNWNIMHKIPQSNKDIIMNREEVKKILDFLKINHFTYYLIFRIFAETGMRKGELINIDYDKVNLKKRYIDTFGKRGRKVYYISQDLRDYLSFFIESRKLKEVETKSLFLSKFSRRNSKRPLNIYLKGILRNLNLNEKVSCKTFRSTLNTLRFEMGCRDPILSILLCHSVQGVNFNHYVKLNYEKYLQLFDQWNPFQKIQI
ncbi:MAG: tyrosine-type recombinase/integrase [Candidatus Odinarchaeota archaeon]